MPAVDFKTTWLTKDGRVVDSLRITGFVAELALSKSKKTWPGLAALRPQHLPEQVTLYLDGKGNTEVKVYEENRILAIEVAKAVRAQLHNHGFEVQDARVGKHDIIVELVVDASGKVPACSHSSSVISVEMKLRRIWSESGREKIRGILRKECESECDWWQAAASKFCGRMIILVEFGSSGVGFVTRAELKLVGEDAEFKGIWGWRGSRSSAASSLAPPVDSVSHSRLAPSLGRATSRAGLSAWAKTKAILVRDEQFRKVDGKLVASVPRMYKASNKDAKHAGEKVAAGKRRHGWTDAQVFKAPRTNDKKGGSPEWVAVESVLRKLFDEAC